MNMLQPDEVIEGPFVMSVDLNVLNHLGLNLYSNRAAVLSEAVANAWDADAQRVDIKVEIGLDGKVTGIEIQDNGHGMTLKDINEKFLTVGYRRRAKGDDRTPRGRSVMGRKGIGKLSFFSLGSTIEVHTLVKGGQPMALLMRRQKIEEAMENGRKYFPEPIAFSMPPQVNGSGTRIVLRDIDVKRWTTTSTALVRKLSRRFAVLGSIVVPPFHVFLNGDEIKPAQRTEFSKVEFLWDIEDEIYPDEYYPLVTKREHLSGIVDRAKGWHVTGWIGAVEKPEHLKVDDDILNGIVVMARGRLIQEDILKALGSARISANYLIGEIRADFLDNTDAPDIATSDRQRLLEEDERYVALADYLAPMIRKITNEWTRLRNLKGGDQALNQDKVLAEWYESLPKTQRGAAKRMLGNIRGLTLDKESDRTELYRSGVLAFERLRLHDEWDKLDLTSVERILPLLADRQLFEASLYRDIVRSRLDVINVFRGLVDANKKEKLLQEHLFKNLWLLDPAWERANESEQMERSFYAEFYKRDPRLFREILGSKYDDTKNRRYDIRYRTISGQHILVELKRANVKIDIYELLRQGKRYEEALTECLRHSEDSDDSRKIPDIRIVFVVGPGFTTVIDAQMQGALISLHAQVITYDRLIARTQAAYASYMAQSESADKVSKLLDRMGAA